MLPPVAKPLVVTYNTTLVDVVYEYSGIWEVGKHKWLKNCPKFWGRLISHAYLHVLHIGPRPRDRSSCPEFPGSRPYFLGGL